MIVRAVRQRDAADWEQMRQILWPSGPGEHAREIQAFFDGDRQDPAEVFIALENGGRAVGFAEVSIRPYAEGCYSGRVAYLEGWFVRGRHRGQGVGGALLKAVEEWGRAQGCRELGSDAEMHNTTSQKAHRALGFSEVGRLVCFRKGL